jgi:hypothetical protein
MGINGKMVLARVYTYLAEMALWEGEFDQAEQWLAQSVVHHVHPRWIRIELVDCLWVATRLATAQKQYRRAATLFGLAEQVGSQIGYVLVGPVRVQVDTALAIVRKALGAELFAKAFTLGQQFSLNEAFATILAPAHLTNPAMISGSSSSISTAAIPSKSRLQVHIQSDEPLLIGRGYARTAPTRLREPP